MKKLLLAIILTAASAFGQLNFYFEGPAVNAPIVSGSVTFTADNSIDKYILQAETGPADTLTDINLTDGQIVWVWADAGDTITIEEGSGINHLGMGDLVLTNGSDNPIAVLYMGDGTNAVLKTVSPNGISVLEPNSQLAIADLGDSATPSVLTTDETTNKFISNFQSSGADHVFTMPAPHAKGQVGFPVGDEFQVDVEPNSGDLFYLSGTAMAIDEHIQNPSDTLLELLVGITVNVNGTLRWSFSFKSGEGWVEATP